MLTRKNDAEGSFLGKDEEARLRKSLKKALISDNPNPERVGCPEPQTLRDIAFHKKLRNPKLLEEVTGHVAGCSACVRDSLAYAEEYKEQMRKRRSNQLVLAASAAALVLAVALWAAWHFQARNSDLERAGKVPTPPSQNPSVNSGDQNKQAPERTEYQTATIELPARWRDDPRALLPTFVLNREKLLVTVRLPVGSPDGKYGFRILDRSKKVLVTAQGSARTDGGSTSLKVPLDTSGLSPGDHTLRVLEPGMNEWIGYSLVIR